MINTQPTESSGSVGFLYALTFLVGYLLNCGDFFDIIINSMRFSKGD